MPFTILLLGGVDFCWTPVCQQAFEKIGVFDLRSAALSRTNLIRILHTEASVLSAPKFDHPFQLQVEASNVGAVLLQRSEDIIDHPVGFFSKKFNSFQLNYSVRRH